MSILKSQILNFKLLGLGYLITIVAFFFYSFTQVDLNLTLSQASWWKTVQNFFQHIGYFNRPLSSVLYVMLVLLLFVFYIFFIKLAHKNRISTKNLWILILVMTGILTFSYNAFSYDLFNYIFDTKIITFYHQSPYMHKALDYMGDPMLFFMRWTHRTYPYGPVWLLLTTPLSFLGLNFFLPTFFLFKIFNSLYFLGTAYFISKILKKVNVGSKSLGVVLFALNPLVIIESLISSHNDTSMMFFAVLSVCLLIENKKLKSLLSLFFSIGIKFATVFLIPAYLYYLLKQKSENFSLDKFLNFIFFVMFIPVILATIRTTFQPWYLLYIIPFASLIPRKNYAISANIILAFFAVIQYVPFLYKGDWNSPVPEILMWITILGAALYIVYVLLSIKFAKLSILSRK